MIHLKTPAEIEIMAEGGKRLAAILTEVASHVKAGIKTSELDRLARELIEKHDGTSTFLGFHNYPAAVCVSLNAEVVHGIPGPRVMQPGDLVGIDIGLRYKGFCTDTALTVAVDPVDKSTSQLVTVTEEALAIGLEQAKPGNRVGDIGHAIQVHAEAHGFGVVRDLTGHGIGRNQWEEPSIPNFGQPGTGPLLREGMVIAIEPMVTAGDPTVRQLDDDWTIVTADGSLASHCEHTIAITADGHRVLTTTD